MGKEMSCSEYAVIVWPLKGKVHLNGGNGLRCLNLYRELLDIDVEHCPNCGSALKIIAAIEDPPVIIKIVSHLGLPSRAPPRTSARRVDLVQTI